MISLCSYRTRAYRLRWAPSNKQSFVVWSAIKGLQMVCIWAKRLKRWSKRERETIDIEGSPFLDWMHSKRVEWNNKQKPMAMSTYAKWRNRKVRCYRLNHWFRWTEFSSWRRISSLSTNRMLFRLFGDVMLSRLSCAPRAIAFDAPDISIGTLFSIVPIDFVERKPGHVERFRQRFRIKRFLRNFTDSVVGRLVSYSFVRLFLLEVRYSLSITSCTFYFLKWKIIGDSSSVSE